MEMTMYYKPLTVFVVFIQQFNTLDISFLKYILLLKTRRKESVISWWDWELLPHPMHDQMLVIVIKFSLKYVPSYKTNQKWIYKKERKKERISIYYTWKVQFKPE